MKMEFEMQMSYLNDQTTAIIDEQMQQMELLAETISDINANMQAMNDKDEQRQGASHARRAGEHLGAQCAIFQLHEDARHRSNC